MFDIPSWFIFYFGYPVVLLAYLFVVVSGFIRFCESR